MANRLISRLLLLFCFSAAAFAQTTPSFQLVQPQGPTAPPVVITLQDALDRAKTLDVAVQAAIAEAALAHEDRSQAKAALLPSISHTTQYLGTQGNGVLPSGRFVSNDGVHLYRSWAVLHQDITPDTFLKTGLHRADAAEALAAAKVEIAQRGLVVAVTKNYYALVTAQRKYASNQTALQGAQRFLDNTQRRENAGEVARADVVRAQLQLAQQQAAYQDAQLIMENARLTLAVMMFPGVNENFTVVDDLDSPRALPPFTQAQSMGEERNPDLRAAEEALRQAGFEVRSARNAFLPTLSIDGNYGIEANAFALRSTVAAAPEFGPLPNLGYFVVGNLQLPIFDWGARRSKVQQARLHEQQAKVELTATQRQLVSNLQAFYNEAMAARAAIELLRPAADLAADKVRLMELRYGAGESTALEVVDAQRTLLDAQNAYNDGQARYRVALANLQTVTGPF